MKIKEDRDAINFSFLRKHGSFNSRSLIFDMKLFELGKG